MSDPCSVNTKVGQIITEYRALCARCCSPNVDCLALLPANLLNLCGDGRGLLKEIWDAVNVLLANTPNGCQPMQFSPYSDAEVSCEEPPIDPDDVECLTAEWLDQFICWIRGISCGGCPNEWDWQFEQGYFAKDGQWEESGFFLDYQVPLEEQEGGAVELTPAGPPTWSQPGGAEKTVRMDYADALYPAACGGSDNRCQLGIARCCFVPLTDGVLSIRCTGLAETFNSFMDWVSIYVNDVLVFSVTSTQAAVPDPLACAMESKDESTGVAVQAGEVIQIRVETSTGDPYFHTGAFWQVEFSI